jgi:hypothetical protein
MQHRPIAVCPEGRLVEVFGVGSEQAAIEEAAKEGHENMVSLGMREDWSMQTDVAMFFVFVLTAKEHEAEERAIIAEEARGAYNPCPYGGDW